MHPATRLALAAFVASALSAQAKAEVQMFEDVPSLEQLRAILVPGSHQPGMARKIVLPRREDLGQDTAVQPAAVQPAAIQPAIVKTVSSPEEGEEARTPAATAKTKTAKTEAPRAVGFRINFPLNSAVIPEKYFAHLEQMAAFLRQEHGLVIAIEGHTDALGGDIYNLELSRRRAEAVTHYLIEHGVESERLKAVGKGKAEPLLADPLDPRNRRVQFVRLDAERAS